MTTTNEVTTDEERRQAMMTARADEATRQALIRKRDYDDVRASLTAVERQMLGTLEILPVADVVADLKAAAEQNGSAPWAVRMAERVWRCYAAGRSPEEREQILAAAKLDRR